MTGRYQSPLYRSIVERAKRNERQEDDPQSAKRNLTMTGPHPDPLALDQNLEPSAVATLGTATSTVIDASAAISLKRIADALEALTAFTGAQSPAAIHNALYGTVTNLAYEAGRMFQAGIRSDR